MSLQKVLLINSGSTYYFVKFHVASADFNIRVFLMQGRELQIDIGFWNLRRTVNKRLYSKAFLMNHDNQDNEFYRIRAIVLLNMPANPLNYRR